MSGLSTRDVWKSDAVEVVFEKTGVRRYAVSVHRPGLPVLRMDPAPGFDRYFPHDMQHLIVEEQLGLRDGIFWSSRQRRNSLDVPSRRSRRSRR
jgi:hypothetical protein